jgi:hypothetical protein
MSCLNIQMNTLAQLRLGRILLHLLAMAGDRCVRFHVAGIMRELPSAAMTATLLFGVPAESRLAIRRRDGRGLSR